MSFYLVKNKSLFDSGLLDVDDALPHITTEEEAPVELAESQISSINADDIGQEIESEITAVEVGVDTFGALNTEHQKHIENIDTMEVEGVEPEVIANESAKIAEAISESAGVLSMSLSDPYVSKIYNQGLLGITQPTLDNYKEGVLGVGDFLKKIKDKIVSFFKMIWDKIKQFWKWLFGSKEDEKKAEAVNAKAEELQEAVNDPEKKQQLETAEAEIAEEIQEGDKVKPEEMALAIIDPSEVNSLYTNIANSTAKTSNLVLNEVKASSDSVSPSTTSNDDSGSDDNKVKATPYVNVEAPVNVASGSVSEEELAAERKEFKSVQAELKIMWDLLLRSYGGRTADKLGLFVKPKQKGSEVDDLIKYTNGNVKWIVFGFITLAHDGKYYYRFNTETDCKIQYSFRDAPLKLLKEVTGRYITNNKGKKQFEIVQVSKTKREINKKLSDLENAGKKAIIEMSKSNIANEVKNIGNSIKIVTRETYTVAKNYVTQFKAVDKVLGLVKVGLVNGGKAQQPA